MAPQTVSILGCGYLGLPLARALRRDGWHVKGSTTTSGRMDMLREAGVEPHLLRLAPEFSCDPAPFLDSDALFFNVPPGRRRPDVEAFYAALTGNVLGALRRSSVGFVVFASSTSVYPSAGGPFREEAAGTGPPRRPSGRALLDTERRLRVEASFDTTVLRFAGLYGYERAPGRFVKGVVGGGDGVVNLVHLDDAVGAARAVLTGDARGEIFNVCADGHPTRAEFYTLAAEWLGMDPPRVETGSGPVSGRVCNRRIKRRLGYAFLWPDPLRRAP